MSEETEGKFDEQWDDGDFGEMYIRLGKVERRVTISLGAGLAGIVLGLAANYAVTKLANVVGQVAGVINAAQVQAAATAPIPMAAPPAQEAYKSDLPAHLRSVDETRVVPAGMVVAEPSEGPRTDLSEAAKAAIASDPLNPGRLAKEIGPQL